jgi:hypothetical protein
MDAAFMYKKNCGQYGPNKSKFVPFRTPCNYNFNYNYNFHIAFNNSV